MGSMMFPVPDVLSDPVQVMLAPEVQEVSVTFTGGPEQIFTVSGVAVTFGAGLIVIVLGASPGTVSPQASVTIGGGTVSVWVFPQ